MKSFTDYLTEQGAVPPKPDALKDPSALYHRTYRGMSGNPVHEYSIPHENLKQVESGLEKEGYKKHYANQWDHDNHSIGLKYRGYKPKYEDPARDKIKYDEGEKWR